MQLMERLLPRQMQLIYEINAEILTELRSRPQMDDPFLSRRLAHRRELWPLRPHGASGFPGRPPGQRRLGPARRADEADRVPQAAPPVSRPDHNETNGVTPRRWVLDCQPGTGRADQRDLGRSRWIVDLERLEELVPRAERRRLPRPLRRDQAANKEHLAGFIARRARAGAADRCPVRHPDQAHPRVQAAAAQHPGGGRDLRRSARRGRSRLARVKIFAGKAAPSAISAPS